MKINEIWQRKAHETDLPNPSAPPTCGAISLNGGTDISIK